MPDYEAANFDPPAPVAYVTLRHPATGTLLSEVPILIDTGADVSLLPSNYITDLGIEVVNDKVYEVQGFEGELSLLRIAQLDLVFLKRRFTGQFSLFDQTMGILGRNILHSVSILLDGINERWEEHNDK